MSTHPTRYFTTFSNGLIFHSMYFEPDSDPLEVEQLRKRVAMLAMLPRETCAGTLDLLTKDNLNAEECVSFTLFNSLSLSSLCSTLFDSVRLC